MELPHFQAELIVSVLSRNLQIIRFYDVLATPWRLIRGGCLEFCAVVAAASPSDSVLSRGLVHWSHIDVLCPLHHWLRLSFFHCSSPCLCGEGFGKLHRRLCVSSAGLSLRVVIMPVTAVQSLLDHLIILLAGAKPHVSPAPRMTPKAQMIDFNPTTPDCDHTAISFFSFFVFFSTVLSTTT